MFKKPLCPNSVNPPIGAVCSGSTLFADQTAPICSGSTLFASLLNASEMLGNYLQQTTSADDILHSFLCASRVKTLLSL